jgi:hypothetical protein
MTSHQKTEVQSDSPIGFTVVAGPYATEGI